MKKPSYAMGIIVDDIFCPINTDREKEQGVYLEILNPIAKQFEDMLSFHSKVFYMRFDLSVCELTDDNEAVSKFIPVHKRAINYKVQIKAFWLWLGKRVGYSKETTLPCIYTARRSQSANLVQYHSIASALLGLFG